LKLIPDEVKRQILRLWMDGMTFRQISLEKKVSTGEISNMAGPICSTELPGWSRTQCEERKLYAWPTCFLSVS
jgi:hypothetical protein